MKLEEQVILFKTSIPKYFYDIKRKIILDLGPDLKKTDQYKEVAFLKKTYNAEKGKNDPEIKTVLLSDPDTSLPYLALIQPDKKEPELDLEEQVDPVTCFEEKITAGIDNLCNLVALEAIGPRERTEEQIALLSELRKKRNKVIGSNGRIHEDLSRIEENFTLPESAQYVTLEAINQGKRNRQLEGATPAENHIFNDLFINGREATNRTAYFYHRTRDEDQNEYELRFSSKTNDVDYYWLLIFAMEFNHKVTIEFADDETFQSRTKSTILNVKKIDFPFDAQKVRDWMNIVDTKTREIF